MLAWPALCVWLLGSGAAAQTFIAADNGIRPDVWYQRALLFEDYDAALPPPNMRNKDPLHVRVGLSVIKVDFDILSSTLTLGIWLRLKWLDERLLYDPDVVFGAAANGLPAYNNETYLPMPMTTGDNVNIWVPDIYCVNATDSMEGLHKQSAYIHHNKSPGYLNPSDGIPYNVMLSRPGTINVHCSPDLTQFPFDRPNCTLDFESWGFSGSYLHLENMTEGWQAANDMPLSIDYRFDDAGAFSWNDSSLGSASEEAYSACSGEWSKYRVVMNLRRLPSYHITHSVVPLTIVVLLGALTFWLPIQSDSSGSGERLGYTVTLLLTVIAIMLFTAEKRPAIAATTWLDKWQTRSLLLSTVPVIETIMIFWLQNMTLAKDDGDDGSSTKGGRKSIVEQDKALTKSAAKALHNVVHTIERFMPKVLFIFLGPLEAMNIDNWFQILFPLLIVVTFGKLPLEIINIVRERGFVHGTQFFSFICFGGVIMIMISVFFIWRRFVRACVDGCCSSEGDGDTSGSESMSEQQQYQPAVRQRDVTTQQAAPQDSRNWNQAPHVHFRGLPTPSQGSSNADSRDGLLRAGQATSRA